MSDHDTVVALIHSHHLLDHKPDNLLLKGGKYKLKGVACLGRPGVALCVGPMHCIDNFRSSLEQAMPQKKFGTVILDKAADAAEKQLKGFEPATLGELRKIMASIGHEEQFFVLTGLDPSSSSATASNASNGKKGGGKKKKKK